MSPCFGARADFAYSSPLRTTHNDLALQSFFLWLRYQVHIKFKTLLKPSQEERFQRKTNQPNKHPSTNQREKKLDFQMYNQQLKVPFNLARFYFMRRSIGYRNNGTIKGKLICIKQKRGLNFGRNQSRFIHSAFPTLPLLMATETCIVLST